MKIKRILHPSDFSKASRPALKLARDLARSFKAELIVCHAIHPVVPMAAGEVHVPIRVIQEMWSSAKQDARRRLAGLARSAAAGGARVRSLIVEGPAAEAIVRAARRQRADLIVLGTHGRTGMRRLLIGSVAERVVRTAKTPVLTVAP